MKVLAVEPHGDDLLLACKSFLELDGNEIDMITVSDRYSANLNEEFKSIKSVEFLDYEGLGYNGGTVFLKTYVVHRDYQNKIPIYQNYLEFLMNEAYEPDQYNKAYKKLYNSLYSRIKSSNYELILAPIGLVQPNHMLLGHVMRNITKEVAIPVLHYIEKPYIANRYCKEMYEDYKARFFDSKFYEINPGYPRIKGYNADVEKLVRKYYPTELRLFRFDYDILNNYPCMYVTSDKAIYDRYVNVLSVDNFTKNHIS